MIDLGGCFVIKLRLQTPVACYNLITLLVDGDNQLNLTSIKEEFSGVLSRVRSNFFCYLGAERFPRLNKTNSATRASSWIVSLAPSLSLKSVSPTLFINLSLIHISEPTRRTPISYAVFCLKKKKKK